MVEMPSVEDVMEATGLKKHGAQVRLSRYIRGDITLDELLAEKAFIRSGNAEWKRLGNVDRRAELYKIAGVTPLERRVYYNQETTQDDAAWQTEALSAEAERFRLRDEIVARTGLTRDGASYRMAKFRRGEITRGELFLPKQGPLPPRPPVSPDDEQIREIVRRAGVTRSTARYRLRLFRAGARTEAELYAPPKTKGRQAGAHGARGGRRTGPQSL